MSNTLFEEVEGITKRVHDEFDIEPYVKALDSVISCAAWECKEELYINIAKRPSVAEANCGDIDKVEDILELPPRLVNKILQRYEEQNFMTMHCDTYKIIIIRWGSHIKHEDDI